MNKKGFTQNAFTLAEGRLACTTTQTPAKGGQVQDSERETIQLIKKTGLEKQNAGLTHVTNLFPCKRCAFTLAEVLITLAVIGIVAVLTLPNLIQNHNKTVWTRAQDLWEKKLTETVRRMNTDGVMTGHKTTEDFMDTFKNYMKVIKTCDNNDINKCYSPKVVTTGSEEEPIDVETSELKTAENLGNSEWGTNTMSFVIADGTTVIMAYNPKCAYVDPIEDTGSQVSCLGFMVDVNGKKGPNRVGDDIALKGQISLSNCDNPIGDMCWSTDFVANTAINTCEGSPYVDLDDQPGSHCSNNYWAGVKKACSDMGMELPTRAQLAQLASELYVNSSDGRAVTIEANEDKSELEVKEEYKDKPPLTLGYSYWSDEESNASGAYYRAFATSMTLGSDIFWGGKHNINSRAICVSN